MSDWDVWELFGWLLLTLRDQQAEQCECCGELGPAFQLCGCCGEMSQA